MNFDYDRLRVTVQNLDTSDHKLARIAQWAVGDQAEDLARELLRLRDGVEVIRDRCATLAKSAQEAGILTLAREMDINAKALTGLLKGS